MAAHCRCKAITCLYLPIIVSWKASLSAALKAVAYVAPTMTVCNSFCLQHPCLIIFGITVLIPISQNRGQQDKAYWWKYSLLDIAGPTLKHRRFYVCYYSFLFIRGSAMEAHITPSDKVSFKLYLNPITKWNILQITRPSMCRLH